MLKTYSVYITATDGTEVDAHNEEEAKELAWTVFRESGWNGLDGIRVELDIGEVRQYDGEDNESNQ